MTEAVLIARRARRPIRRMALAGGLAAVLTMLCCLGGLASFFLSGSDTGDDSLLAAAYGCGEHGPVDPASKLPDVAGYGQTQIRNAAIIVNVGARMKVPVRGWVIAVATAIQESSLVNLPYLGKDRNDHDSVGLFQQRPSQGWGTAEQLQDPEYASRKFYDKLLDVPGWQHLPLTEAAQAVQVSAYPDAYAKHEADATLIVNMLANGAARAAADANELRCAAPGEITASGWTAPVRAGIVSGFRTPQRPTHDGVDLGAHRHDPIVAAAAGLVITAACDGDSTGQLCQHDGSPSTPGCGWYVKVRHDSQIVTMYCHMQRRPLVKVGDRVTAGQQIGIVGTTGNSSGPHLHFEVQDARVGDAVNPVLFMRERGVILGDEG